jgi:hypothetical protein
MIYSQRQKNENSYGTSRPIDSGSRIVNFAALKYLVTMGMMSD